MSALSFTVVLALASQPSCTVPGMVPDFWPMVVRQESHYDPNALHDDTTGQSYYPADADAAEALATRLMTAGHSVGVGLSQLTASSQPEFWAKFRLTIHAALNPCANMHAGAAHYVSRSLAIFNSGRPDSPPGVRYATAVQAVRVVNDAATATASPCPEPDPAGWHVMAMPRDCTVEQAWHAIPQQKDPR